MTAQSGQQLILEIQDDDTPSLYHAVGGFRTNSFTISGTTVDVTNKDSLWGRQLLDEGGRRSLSTSGSGVFMSDTVFANVSDKLMKGRTANWRITVPGLGTFEGPFIVTRLEMAGRYDVEITYTVALDSAGDITFTAE